MQLVIHHVQQNVEGYSIAVPVIVVLLHVKTTPHAPDTPRPHTISVTGKEKYLNVSLTPTPEAPRTSATRIVRQLPHQSHVPLLQQPTITL